MAYIQPLSFRNDHDMPSLTEKHNYGAPFQYLPVDVLPAILAQLALQRDWYACTLVNKLFNRLATPCLYSNLDSRVMSKTFKHHMSYILLKRPELARYVRHITETGAIHCGMIESDPKIVQHTINALALCSNLHSLTWVDDSTCSTDTLSAILAVVKLLHVRSLTIRTYNALGADVWNQLFTLSSVTRLAIWCMQGPPLTMRSSSTAFSLGASLTHLELGVSSFEYPLHELFSHFPHIQNLRLKGAPAAALPMIISCLPALRVLDTEYFTGTSRHLAGHEERNEEDNGCRHISALRHLTVRTTSLDMAGAHRLWSWLRKTILPSSGLESFRLNALAYSFPPVLYSPPHAAPKTKENNVNNVPVIKNVGVAYTAIGAPRCFLHDMSSRYAETLTELVLGDAPLSLADITRACSVFPRLTVLGCSLIAPNVDAVIKAISAALQLTTLKLKVQCSPGQFYEKRCDEMLAWSDYRPLDFSIVDARRMMCHSDESKLRSIGIGHVQYTGKWILQRALENKGDLKRAKDGYECCKPVLLRKGMSLEFVVFAEVADERWNT